MLNVRELITGRSAMLKAVVRFNNAHRQKDESVAEHSFYVALFSLFLARHVERLNAKNLESIPCIHYFTLFSRCLLHDLEEARSGDFPRNFKYSVPEVKEGLDRAAAIALRQVIEPLFVEDLNDARLDATVRDESERQSLEVQWRHAKADDAEGRIVGLADILSTVQYVWLEVQRGNRQILRDAADIPRNVYDLCDDATNRQLFGPALLLDIRTLVEELYRD